MLSMQVELRQTSLWPGLEDLLSLDSETVCSAYPLLCNHSSYGEFLCDFSSFTPILLDRVFIYAFICVF